MALCALAFKGEKSAFAIYSKNNKPSSYEAMLSAASKADIVLIGELHNNPICHWLEYELTKDIYLKKGKNTVLGAEMFEADNQWAVSSYLKGEMSADTFKKKCRLWPNYATDYKPLLDFAKDSGLHFVATNIPRKYASLLFKKGPTALDSLSASEKQWMTPLPFLYDSNLVCYKSMLKMMEGHGGQNFPMAQAIKDATMSHFLLQNWKPGQIFIHYNGSYHSNNFESMYWYLKKANPNLKIVTIASAEQKVVTKLEKDNQKLADFIIVIPETMTKTY